MKNIAKALLVLLATTCAASAYAKPILNETQGKEYRTLRDAVKRAESGDVIIVNESVTLTSPINPEERELTIKGASQDVVVTYDVTTSNGQHSTMIVFDKDVIGGVINIENITFEGNPDVDLESNYILVRNGGTLNLKNVTFKDFKCSAKNGILRALSDLKSEEPALSTVTLDNVKFVSCTAPVDVLVANNKTTIKLSGDCRLSLSLNNAAGVAIDAEGLTNTQPIKLFAQRRGTGKVIVKGCNDVAKFNWVDAAGLSLAAKGDNIVTE